MLRLLFPFRTTALFLLCASIASAAPQHLLYVGRAPKERDGFRTLKPSIEVHDIDHGHKLVKVIPLPPDVFALRGMCASAATKRLYLSHYGQMKGHSPQFGNAREGGGRLLCFDLEKETVLWDKAYPPSADRMAITPDGKKIYFPAGEERSEAYWTVIDAMDGKVISRVPGNPKSHNTICSLDGKLAFLQGFGVEGGFKRTAKGQPPVDLDPSDKLTTANGFLPDEMRMLTVVDTKTDQILRQIGPFAEKTRPFTINGTASLVFVTVNDLVGFQVGEVASGKVLWTAQPPGSADLTTKAGPKKFRQPQEWNNGTACHGIALTADEKECWTVDQMHIGLHYYDISGLPRKAPQWKGFVGTRTGKPDIFGQPGWIMSTIDSRYFYPETGEIIDTREKKVVGQLIGADHKPTHSRFALEVVLDEGVVTAVGDQFGVGRVRP